jgi:hypothetical protein
MKVSRKEFLKSLEPLKPAISGRSSITELSHIWFDGAYAYAYDGGMGVRVKLETPFKLGVSGALLLGLLGQAGGDEVNLEEGDDALVFRSGRSKAKLVAMPLDRRVWNYKDNVEQVAAITMSKLFLEGLKRVMVVKPSSPKRMEHHGIALFPLENSLDLYTTDSATMAFMPVDETVKGEITSTVIPRGFAEQILAQVQPGAELFLLPACFVIEANPKVTLYSNVFDTSGILDFQGMVSKHADQKANKPFELPEGFTDALERAVLLAGPADPVVFIQTKGAALHMKGRFKFGQLDEDFELSSKQPNQQVALLADQLLRIKNVDQMSLSSEAGVLFGKDDFIFVSAVYTSKETKDDTMRGVATEAA